MTQPPGWFTITLFQNAEDSMMKTIAAGLLAICCVSMAAGGDWPRRRGPNLKGYPEEKGCLDQWPADGPTIAWKAAVGTGYSSVAVSQGRLYTMGHKDDQDTIYCLDAVTGKQLWAHAYTAELGDNNFEGG